MNAKPSACTVTPMIDDVQGRPDTRKIPIDRVGIKDIYHPVRVKVRSGGEQHTIANFNMYVHLPHNFKGTHMSRFVEILNEHEQEISVESFNAMLAQMAERLDSRPRATNAAAPDLGSTPRCPARRPALARTP